MARLEHPVLLGEIGAPHGVRGELRVKSFTADPLAIAGYGELADDSGRVFTITAIRATKGEGMVIARFAGVADRNAAERLTHTKLYVERAALPGTDDDEFYYSDLEGLRAELADGSLFGDVVAVHDFGAGVILEIRPVNAASLYVPFTRAAVPLIDIAGGRLVLDPPDGLLTGDGERR